MKLRHYLILASFLPLLATAKISKHFSGTVVDSRSRQPIADVSVRFNSQTVYTDAQGHFSINDSIDNLPEQTYQLTHIHLYTLQGTQLAVANTLDEARQQIAQLPYAPYLFVSSYDNGQQRSSIVTPQSTSIESLRRSTPITLHTQAADQAMLTFAKNGFYSQQWPEQSDSVYQILATSYPNLRYLNSLINSHAFEMLKGVPLLPKQSEISSVKVVYSLQQDSIYFVNSNQYVFHYDFTHEVFDDTRSIPEFTYTEYTQSSSRRYILATLNHYESSNIWGLEFFSGDQVACSLVERMYKAIAQSSFFGDSLRLVLNSTRFETCTTVPAITLNQINNTQRYQALNVCSGYGYLRKIKSANLGTAYPNRHDIVVLDSVPLDISPVSGIITAQFQTPLCHINILSHNRQTPNMALRNAMTDTTLTRLENSLVYLNVAQDSFFIRPASIAEAQAFWSLHEPSVITNLQSDTTIHHLVSLQSSSISDLQTIGGKASNFAELYHIKPQNANLSAIPLPEGAFAIPFTYYAQHLRANKIDTAIAQMLRQPQFYSDLAYRKTQLVKIQSLIKAAPIDTALLGMVKRQIATNGQSFIYYRFRSSTNTEDVEDFNGAGLYDSYTGSLIDIDKPIDRAIKKVWASVWNINAFEEREYYKINHQTVQMAVLVHRSFPAEEANGVIISSIIYDRPDIQYGGVTINAQYGETSITNPVGNYLPDQIICYDFTMGQFKYTIEYIGQSTLPHPNKSTVLTNDEIILLTDLCFDIRDHFRTVLHKNVTLDIEFKIDILNGQRKLYIKQARTY